MSRLTWGVYGERFYEAGVDQGVLYLASVAGVAWTGLISVSESPTGGEAKPYYVDGYKYLNLSSAEEFEATLNAYSSPSQFRVCDGEVAIHTGLYAAQQPRKSFGLSYRTRVGNDSVGTDHAYKIHIVYNALAEPSSRNHRSLGDTADPDTFSWAITTRPPTLTGYKPTAHFIVDSRTADAGVLAELEDILYGTDEDDPALPTPAELIALFAP